MGASYFGYQREDGRCELEIESNALYGILLSGPQGFPDAPQESRKWWGPARWLAWAGQGSEWVHVDLEVD